MNKQTKILVAVASISVVLIVVAFFVISRNDESESTGERNLEKNTASSTKPSQNSTTSTEAELRPSTTAQNSISISISTPTNKQNFQNEIIAVRTIIVGATSGTCKAVLSNSESQDVSIEAPIVQAPTYFTCAGFDIDSKELTAKGEWELKIVVDAPNGSKTSETRKITVS